MCNEKLSGWQPIKQLAAILTAEQPHMLSCAEWLVGPLHGTPLHHHETVYKKSRHSVLEWGYVTCYR